MVSVHRSDRLGVRQESRGQVRWLFMVGIRTSSSPLIYSLPGPYFNGLLALTTHCRRPEVKRP